MTGYIWDIALVAVIIFFISASAKKGFIRASKNIIALILTVVLLASMQNTMLEFLQSSPLGDNIKHMVSENIGKTYQKEQLSEDIDTTDTEKSLMVCEALSLPSFLSDSIESSIKQMSEIKNNVMEVVTDSMTLLIMKVIAMLLLFVLVRVFVFLVLKLLESLFGLPGLKAINRTLGALVGVFNAMLAIYIICGAVSLLTPTDKLAAIQETVNSTYILKYFYENNLLLSFFV
ncbi:MAG: CvpA family protein [Clostridia bacterium]|nr:CvpA family protein [Clostridia bacterium]